MSLIHAIVTAVKSHPQAATAVALWFVATLKTLFTKRPTVESGLDLLAEILGSGSYKGEKGQIGRLTLPVLGRSRSAVSTRTGKVNMLPFLFVGMLATIPACAALQALGVCEIGSLPQTTQSAIACAMAAANSSAAGGDNQGALSTCVTALAPTQASCVMQAVMTFLKGSVPAHGQASDQTLIAISRIRAYLDAHPVTSCVGDNRIKLVQHPLVTVQ